MVTKSSVFSLFLKLSIDRSLHKPWGRSYQSWGPTTLKALPWTNEDDIYGTCKSLWLAKWRLVMKRVQWWCSWCKWVQKMNSFKNHEQNLVDNPFLHRKPKKIFEDWCYVCVFRHNCQNHSSCTCWRWLSNSGNPNSIKLQ